MKWILIICLTLLFACNNSSKKPPQIEQIDKKTKEIVTEEIPHEFKIKFTTTKGDFVLGCHKKWGPIGIRRLYNLIKIGFYNNVKFFRYVPGFVVQFGISGDPKVSEVWKDANIKDDPVKKSNIKGTLSFATAGPNTRTTQLFINLNNNSRLDSMGFAPLCEVESGMETINKLYSGYGEGPSRKQSEIQARGNEFLDKNFPKLDYIKKAEIQ